MKNKIIENLNTKNKTLKFTFNVDKNEISENNFGLKFISNTAKNPLRDEFKEKILEKFENEKKFFEENISLKINDFIGVKKGKEFEIICDLVFQKSSSDADFFLDKKNICEFKNDYFVTFPNRLIQISPVFGLEKKSDLEKFFLELKKNFLENLNNFGNNSGRKYGQKFYENILNIFDEEIKNKNLEKNNLNKLKELEKNNSVNGKILDFFGKIMVTQENIDNKLLKIYEDEFLDSTKTFSKNNGENIFNQKIEIGFNPTKNYFLILDGTHRISAFFDLFSDGKIKFSDFSKFKIEFSESLLTCEKNILEISKITDGDFSEEILKDENISENIKNIYFK